MALHTDEPHPHVHLVLKAISDEGKRLHINSAILREWREGFAHHLRALGVSANATPRYVRGETPSRVSGIYRAAKRGESTHLRRRVEGVADELAKGKLQVESGKAILMRTREEVTRGWLAVRDDLIRKGHSEIAAQAMCGANAEAGN